MQNNLALDRRSLLAVQEAEKSFFRQAFGPIAHGRVDRLKLLSRMLSAEDQRKLLTVKMLFGDVLGLDVQVAINIAKNKVEWKRNRPSMRC